jgi:hypothetical protein
MHRGGLALAMGVVFACACSAPTSLAITLTSADEITECTLAVVVDHGNALSKQLFKNEPHQGTFGPAVVALNDNASTVDVAVTALAVDGSRRGAAQTIAVSPHKRTRVTLELNVPPEPMITVSLEGTGSGTVTGNGINCPGTCTAAVDPGLSVSLTATPSAGSTFEQWTAGPCIGSAQPNCTFIPTMAMVAVTARFAGKAFTVTLTTSANPGATIGTIQSTPAGIDCGGTCTASFPGGTQVTLQPSGGSNYVIWGGACAGSTATCTLTVKSDLMATALFSAANYMFVTSAQFTSDLGGTTGGDMKCMTAAGAAGLGGTYKAYLSTATENAKDRLGSARGWLRTDGQPFVDTVADLVAGKIFYAPRIDEHGHDYTTTSSDGRAMTATDSNGIYSGSGDASGWTVAGSTSGGNASSGSLYWSTNINGGGAARIYCFGVDSSNPIMPPQIPNGGRRAWLSAPIAALTTLDNSDMKCQMEATAKGWTGTFSAALADTTHAIGSRFNVVGQPWYRVDGVKLAATADALFMTGNPTSALDRDINGNVIGDTVRLGAFDTVTPGTDAQTCVNWTSSTAGTTFAWIDGRTAAWSGFNQVTTGCDMTARVVCLEN